MAFEGIRSRWYARQLGSDADLATFRTLHTASLASPALRQGLNPESVERSLKHLRNLLGTAAVAIADPHHLLGYDGLSTHHADQAEALAARAVDSMGTVVAGRARPRLRHRRLPRAARHRQPARDRGTGRRRAGRADRPAVGQPAARDRGGGQLGLRPARAGRARRVAAPADARGGPGAARADQPALHLQLPRRDRLVRAHRSGPGPRAAAGVRRLHPLLLPPARRVHDARRGAALDRALPAARAGPVRRPAARSPCRSRPRCSA